MSKLTAISIPALTALAAAAFCSHPALAQSTSDQTPQSGVNATTPVPAPTGGDTTPNAPSPAAAAPNAPAATAPAPAAITTTPPAAAPTANKVTYTGLVDVYYQFQFNNPKHLPQNNLGQPLYNVRHDQPTISLAELNIAKAANPNQFGFKATLITGDTADINHGGIGVDSNSYQEARFKNIQQLYATYGLKGGAGIDIGKFYTPFGYEVTESNANYNYSRSAVFTNLLPFYHAGLRAYTPNYKGFVLTAYVTNAINDTANEGVHDDNNDKAFLGQINYTAPSGKFVAIENFGTSVDKNLGVLQHLRTTLSDTDFTYNVDANDLVGLNYVYRLDRGYSRFSEDEGGGDEARINQPFVTVSANGTANSNGFAVYLRHQLNPRNAVALRYSNVSEALSGIETLSESGQESHYRLYDITATYEIKSSSQFLTRFEYVHDHANQDVFAGSHGVGNEDQEPNPKKDQDLITASEVFTF